jgi:hypothetical protein
MNNFMIYAIDNTIYIQSSEIMQNVKVLLINDEGDFNRSIKINNSCYEKLTNDAPLGKFKIKVNDNNQVIEKQITIKN